MVSIPSLKMLQKMETIDGIDLLDRCIRDVKDLIVSHRKENRRHLFYYLYLVLLTQNEYLNLRIEDE